MKFFSVHYAEEHSHDPAALSRELVLVPDGFAWGAFLAAPFWFALRAMWIVLAIYVAFVLGLIALSAAELVVPDAILAAFFGLHLLAGWEGHDLHRWSLDRRRKRLRGFVAGADRAAAEHRLLDTVIVQDSTAGWPQ